MVLGVGINKRIVRGLASSPYDKPHGWPCIPQQGYLDGSVDCVDLSDESK